MLVWYYLFFTTTWVHVIRIFHFLIPVGYGYLGIFLNLIPFESICHATAFTHKDGVDANNNSGIQRLFCSMIPTKYQSLSGVAILILVG